MKVELFSKPGCERCLAARKIIESVRAGRPFDFVEIDLSAGDAEARALEPKAPIVRVDGREIGQGRLEREWLVRALARRDEGTSRRLKIAFAVFAAVTLAGILVSKAYQVFVEPDELAMRYLGVVPMDGPAPAFTFETNDGKPVSLADYRGKYVFLNFWATWCDSCRTEMPSMARLAKALGDQPMAMIAATVDESWEPVNAFFGGQPLPFQVLRDPKSKWAGTYGTTKFPETYLIGPDGGLRAKFVGPRDWDDRAFELYFRKLMGDAGGAGARAAAP